MENGSVNGRVCSLEDLLGGGCPGLLITPERRRRIYGVLLKESAGAGDRPSVLVDTGEDELALLAVTAADWPGLATICLSELQYHGWNLDFAEGLAVKDGNVRRGFVIAGILDSDPARRRKFSADAERIRGLLEKLAQGRADTLSLMDRASERLEIYEEVRTELSRLSGDRPVPEEIVGPSGELVLFISSRSDEYLRERKASDLAHMVMTNYELVESVRAHSGRAVFRIRNLKTSREHLTGINIAGYERGISFQDCLTAMSFAWPGASVRHQRRYTTSDGIISIRIEMTGPMGLAADREEIRKITETLRRLLVRNELEVLKKIRRYGGREHYARALIPLLLKECETTRMNQAYIAVEATSTFVADLKLILVTTAADMQEHDGRVLALVGAIDALDGMTVVSYKSPSRYGDRWVDIIDVTVDRAAYAETEDAYGAIKAAMESTVGQVRDFDMGMRLHDVRQLREIRQRLRGIPDSAVTDFYYSLEDFLRAAAPVEELALHIRLAFDTMSEAARSGVDFVEPSHAMIEAGGAKVATLFCCVMPEKAHTFQKLLDTVKEYRVTASLIDWSGLHAVLLRVHGSSGPLEAPEESRIIEELGKVCRSREPAEP